MFKSVAFFSLNVPGVHIKIQLLRVVELRETTQESLLVSFLTRLVCAYGLQKT